MAKQKEKSKGKGLNPKLFSGLDKKRIEKKSSGNFGQRVNLGKGTTLPLQFTGTPEDGDHFMEFDIHVWQEGTWNYVPCAGDDCPLCSDEDEGRRKTSYRFIASVYNHKEKKIQVLEGPKDLAQRIFYKYSRKPEKFIDRVYDITKFPTQPISYGVDVGDDDPLKASVLKKETPIDLAAYVKGEMERYYGNLDTPKASALDDDEDEKSKKKKSKKEKK